MRLTQTLAKAAVILAVIAVALGGAVALGSTLFDTPPRDAADFALRVEAGSVHAAPPAKRTGAERRFIVAASELCAKRDEDVRDLERSAGLNEVVRLRGWQALLAGHAAAFDALSTPRSFRVDAAEAVALDRERAALVASALETRRQGDREGFEAKVRAVDLLGEHYDAAVLRLELPACASA